MTPFLPTSQTPKSPHAALACLLPEPLKPRFYPSSLRDNAGVNKPAFRAAAVPDPGSE